jgi:hypothetical protein
MGVRFVEVREMISVVLGVAGLPGWATTQGVVGVSLWRDLTRKEWRSENETKSFQTWRREVSVFIPSKQVVDLPRSPCFDLT